MRRNIMLVHLIIASLITPAALLVSITGGLYLAGFKGTVHSTTIELPANTRIDINSKDLENDIQSLIESAGIEHEFEYLKVRGNTIQTRPTSRTYLEFTQGSSLTLSKKTPDLQKSLIELHKGHGPLKFKLYQKFVAAGLIIVLLSGLYMGLSNRNLKTKTWVSFVCGVLAFAVLGFL